MSFLDTSTTLTSIMKCHLFFRNNHRVLDEVFGPRSRLSQMYTHSECFFARTILSLKTNLIIASHSILPDKRLLCSKNQRFWKAFVYDFFLFLSLFNTVCYFGNILNGSFSLALFVFAYLYF